MKWRDEGKREWVLVSVMRYTERRIRKIVDNSEKYICIDAPAAMKWQAILTNTIISYTIDVKIGLSRKVAGRMTPILNTLPDKLSSNDVASIRHMHHLTQKELADGLGVSKRTVEAWETGRNNVTGTASKLLCLLRQGDVSIYS